MVTLPPIQPARLTVSRVNQTLMFNRARPFACDDTRVRTITWSGAFCAMSREPNWPGECAFSVARRGVSRLDPMMVDGPRRGVKRVVAIFLDRRLDIGPTWEGA
ncbi:hypothetical protein McPS_24100 [Marichromatium sp. PS1]